MSSNPMIRPIFHGGKEFNYAIKDLDSRIAKATVQGMRENQNLLKRVIKKNLNGKPRSNWRGHMFHGRAIYEHNVYYPDLPASAPRSGGPGKFTGALQNGVGSQRPRVDATGTVTGGVGVGGKVNNFKKYKLETKFPYFAPAVEEASPKFVPNFEKGWAKAIERMGGL
jgi:hypothetical protein